MYAGYQLIFCDPLEHHSKPVRTTQKEITLDYAKGQADLGHVLVPGKKICFGDFNKKDKAIDSFCIESDDEAYCNEEDAYDECNWEKVDSSLSSLDCSPLKQVCFDRVQNYGRMKIIEATQNLSSSIDMAYAKYDRKLSHDAILHTK